MRRGVPTSICPADVTRRSTSWRVGGAPSSRSPQARPTQHLAVDDRGIVQAQLPLALSDFSEPEPDVAVVPPGDYATRHPTHALLVVEVADSSLAKDRGPKARAYAAARSSSSRSTASASRDPSGTATASAPPA